MLCRQLNGMPGELLQKEEQIAALTEQLMFHEQLVEELRKRTEVQAPAHCPR